MLDLFKATQMNLKLTYAAMVQKGTMESKFTSKKYINFLKNPRFCLPEKLFLVLKV